MAERIPVGILGATGSVGQRFVHLLDGHPWFEVVALTASERNLGKSYAASCRWLLDEPMPPWAASMPLQSSLSKELGVRIAFSALPAAQALEVEPRLARAGITVCSNASAFRAEPDVPLLLPEVNPHHADLVVRQRRHRGWRGCIVTNPNCTSTGLTVCLKPLQDAFGLRSVFAVSLQALSGAGYPGVASLDILDNAIPFISGEEEKVETEPLKMLGRVSSGVLVPAGFTISAHTNRIAVRDGHLVCVSVQLVEPVELQVAEEALRAYTAPPESRNLPSAPQPVILLRQESDRPQPRLDRWAGGGMTTVAGRLRRDPLFHLKFVVLSHNTVRGAAGGSIFNAELLASQGLL